MGTLGSRIKELRQAKGLTQSDLAKILNVTNKSISFWETDEKTPRMGKLEELAEYFNTTKSYLIEGKAAETPGNNLSSDELALISYYRSMSKEEKSFFLKILGISYIN